MPAYKSGKIKVSHGIIGMPKAKAKEIDSNLWMKLECTAGGLIKRALYFVDMNSFSEAMGGDDVLKELRETTDKKREVAAMVVACLRR